MLRLRLEPGVSSETPFSTGRGEPPPPVGARSELDNAGHAKRGVSSPSEARCPQRGQPLPSSGEGQPRA
eukprot:1807501-Alexandrium_andersonii.AAC.1